MEALKYRGDNSVCVICKLLILYPKNGCTLNLDVMKRKFKQQSGQQFHQY